MNRKKMSALMAKVLAGAALAASLCVPAYAADEGAEGLKEQKGSVTVVYRDGSEADAGVKSGDISAIPPDVPQKASSGEDAEKEASSVISSLSGDPVSGAEFTFYKVADIADLTEGGADEEDSSGIGISGAAFIPLIEGVQVDDTVDPSSILAAVQEAYKDPGAIDDGAVYTFVTDEEGVGKADNMETGVYLGAETKPAKAHYASIPFLFTIPVTSMDGRSWNYDRIVTPKPLPSGNLVISKMVQGNAANPQDEFGFAVSFSYDGTFKGPDGYHYTRSDGAQGMISEGGVISLKSGQSVRIEEIPAGCRYQVTEQEADKNGYTTSASGDTGTISRKSEAKAEFVNTKNRNTRTAPIQTGDTIWPAAGGILCIVAALAILGTALGFSRRNKKEGAK